MTPSDAAKPPYDPAYNRPRHYLLNALRGPLMLIALGLLLAADQMGQIGFRQTWPALLVLFGVLKLASHLGGSHS